MSKTGEEVRKLINLELQKRERSIRNSNAIDSLFSIIPALKALRDVFTGSKKAIEIKRQQLNIEKILDLVVAIDDKLSGKDISNVDKGLTVLIQDVESLGNVTGIEGKTSSEDTRKVFEKPVDVKIKSVVAAGDVTGVKLNVDKEMPIKAKLTVETELGKVEMNPDLGEITLGKEAKNNPNK